MSQPGAGRRQNDVLRCVQLGRQPPGQRGLHGDGHSRQHGQRLRQRQQQGLLGNCAPQLLVRRLRCGGQSGRRVPAGQVRCCTAGLLQIRVLCLPQTSEVKPEAAVLGLPSRGSSIASSVRRRLSAFSSKVKLGRLKNVSNVLCCPPAAHCCHRRGGKKVSVSRYFVNVSCFIRSVFMMKCDTVPCFLFYFIFIFLGYQQMHFPTFIITLRH